MQTLTRLIIPDSHGAHIDWAAAEAMLADVRALRIDEAVLLGDHIDCGGVLSSHARSYTNELTESLEDDTAACNLFLDKLQNACPRAQFHYIEGNHEQRLERWAAQEIASAKDAEAFLERNGPEALLRLKQRGIPYYKRSTFYAGISIPGTIRLGHCFFTHGISHAKHADAVHLQRFGASVVFGHIHRSMGRVERTVTSQGHGAWCPGTLARLQPLYRHTQPTDWSHGYALQEVLPSGVFAHQNIPIFGGATVGSMIRGEKAIDCPPVPEHPVSRPEQPEPKPAPPARNIERTSSNRGDFQATAEAAQRHMQSKSRKLLKRGN